MIDFHADTIYRLWHEATDQNLQENSLSVSVRGLEKIGAMAQCLAIYTPPQCTWSDMKEIHERFVKEMETCKGHIAQATCTDEIRSNGLSAILTVEDMKATEGDWAKVEEVISWKPRIVGPVWNVANAYANPNSGNKAKMALGLTAQGRQLVELLSSHGIIIDVSHMSDGGFWDLVDMGVPIVATHSDARALVDHPRNLTEPDGRHDQSHRRQGWNRGAEPLPGIPPRLFRCKEPGGMREPDRGHGAPCHAHAFSRR